MTKTETIKEFSDKTEELFIMAYERGYDEATEIGSKAIAEVEEKLAIAQKKIDTFKEILEKI